MTENRSELRSVVHVAQDFVEPSQPWLRDLVALPGSFRPAVVCQARKLDADVPGLPVDAALPHSRRFGPGWIARQANTRARLPVGPLNYWRRALRERVPSADLYHAHFGHCAWMAADAGLRPLVASFYGYDATERRTLRYWGRGYPQLFREVALVVAEGPAMAERLAALGAPVERLRVLPLVASTEDVSWRPPSVDGPVRFVMAGRFVEKKGFHLGIEAFARAGLADATLTVVGEGPEDARLRRVVAREGIGERVRFVPFLGRAAYREELSAADVLLQPSLTARTGDREGGAPTVLLDAMAIGLPVVASGHADIPFVVGPDAYLFPEGDVDALVAALRAAASGRDEWSRRSADGRRHLERQHGPRSVAAARDDIYAEAAAAG